MNTPRAPVAAYLRRRKSNHINVRNGRKEKNPCWNDPDNSVIATPQIYKNKPNKKLTLAKLASNSETGILISLFARPLSKNSEVHSLSGGQVSITSGMKLRIHVGWKRVKRVRTFISYQFTSGLVLQLIKFISFNCLFFIFLK